jgi:hypothetical protein
LFEWNYHLDSAGNGNVSCISYESGWEYKGGYSNGQFNGKGKEKYSDGSTYKGDYSGGERNGKGKLTLNGDSLFKGEWKDGKRWNGKGKETITDSYNVFKIFEGTWLYGKYDGQGEWMCYTVGEEESRETYVGHFAKSIRNGYGVFTYSDGKTYKGEWKDDYKTGYGEEYDADGSLICSGMYVANVLQESDSLI